MGRGRGASSRPLKAQPPRGGRARARRAGVAARPRRLSRPLHRTGEERPPRGNPRGPNTFPRVEPFSRAPRQWRAQRLQPWLFGTYVVLHRESFRSTQKLGRPLASHLQWRWGRRGKEVALGYCVSRCRDGTYSIF